MAQMIVDRANRMRRSASPRALPFEHASWRVPFLFSRQARSFGDRSRRSRKIMHRKSDRTSRPGSRLEWSVRLVETNMGFLTPKAFPSRKINSFASHF